MLLVRCTEVLRFPVIESTFSFTYVELLAAPTTSLINNPGNRLPFARPFCAHYFQASLLCPAKPHESRTNKEIWSNLCWPGFGKISEILGVCIRCLLRRICTFITTAHIFPPLHSKAFGFTFLLTLFRSGFSGAERSSSSFSSPLRCKMESFNRG